MGCFGEVQVNQENGGESLDSIRDDSKEVGMKMSTGGGRFGVRDSHFVDSLSKAMGCFGEVCENQENGGESLDSIRDETGEVGMKLSSRAS